MGTPKDEDILMQARAMENGVYIVYTSPRNAFVVDPYGDIISQVRNDTDGLMYADLVLDERVGDRWAVKVRHPELYERLAQPASAKP
jgi:predicted amidohydrolase